MTGGTDPQPELFGNPEQRAVLRKGLAMHALTRHLPDATYYGRGVGILRPDPAGLELLRSLVTLQGVANIYDVPEGQRKAVMAELEDQGYSLTRYANWLSGADTLTVARRIVDEIPLPEDVTVTVIDAGTAHTTLAGLADVSLSVGVMPIAGPMLRGTLKPGVGVVALDRDGRAVSCAAAASFAHPDHTEFGGLAWWGMLATRSDRGGQGLALILGATAMLAMAERFGVTRFFTGVQQGNIASEKVCGRCGLAPVENAILTVVDASALKGGKLTK